MAVLKSYTCSKCAGILIFDSDQEFFDCPFCGTRFSSVDFHGNELLSQADACFERHEFSAAKEKYKAILAEDARNFNALRGMLLCTIMVSSEKELSDISKLKRANLNRIRNELDTARDFSGKKNWEYFKEHADEDQEFMAEFGAAVLKNHGDLSKVGNEKPAFELLMMSQEDFLKELRDFIRHNPDYYEHNGEEIFEELCYSTDVSEIQDWNKQVFRHILKDWDKTAFFI